MTDKRHSICNEMQMKTLKFYSSIFATFPSAIALPFTGNVMNRQQKKGEKEKGRKMIRKERER
jgi:hypothetical protein